MFMFVGEFSETTQYFTLGVSLALRKNIEDISLWKKVNTMKDSRYIKIYFENFSKPRFLHFFNRLEKKILMNRSLTKAIFPTPSFPIFRVLMSAYEDAHILQW